MSKTQKWQPEFTAGQLIKMGNFKDAIPLFSKECKLAVRHNVVSVDEVFGERGVVQEFNNIMLNPSDFDRVQALGDRLLQMEMRIPNYLKKVDKEEFYRNVKLNYEVIETKD